MEFGRRSYTDLQKDEVVLPNAANSVLPAQRAGNPRLYIGLPKWGRMEWVGKIYPDKTKEEDFLEQYVKHFSSKELMVI